MNSSLLRNRISRMELNLQEFDIEDNSPLRVENVSSKPEVKNSLYRVKIDKDAHMGYEKPNPINL